MFILKPTSYSIVIHMGATIVQFAIGDEVFLMHKPFCVARAIICGLLGKYLFHGAYFTDGVYKVEVHVVMLLNAPSPFPNHKDEPTQLCLKQAQCQFKIWENALM
jgi:hypothetical protein